MKTAIALLKESRELINHCIGKFQMGETELYNAERLRDNIEDALAKPAPDAIEDIVKSAYKRGFADGMESTAETAREILGIGAAPAPDARELLEEARDYFDHFRDVFNRLGQVSSSDACIYMRDKIAAKYDVEVEG